MVSFLTDFSTVLLSKQTYGKVLYKYTSQNKVNFFKSKVVLEIKNNCQLELSNFFFHSTLLQFSNNYDIVRKKILAYNAGGSKAFNYTCL